MIKAVLFDLDGTLADTAPDLALALNRLLDEHGLAPISVEAARPVASSGARGLIEVGFGLTPEDEKFPALRDRFLDLYGETVCVHTRLFEGMPELLAELERRAMPWGIVTNKSARFTVPLLAALGLNGRAACVVSGDTTARIKPAPDSLLFAAKGLRLAPGHCLYIGDDLRDVHAARAAGMSVIAAAYGYLGGNGDPRNWDADGVISYPLETLNFLPSAPFMR